MKKVLPFIAIVLGLLFVSTAIFAQEQGIEPPSDWSDVILNFNQWFQSVAGIAVLTAFLAAFFTGLLKITKGIWKQITAWVIAIALTVISAAANLGFASDFSIIKAIVYGLGAGFVSNGIFDVPVVKGILDAINGWFKPKPPLA